MEHDIDRIRSEIKNKRTMPQVDKKQNNYFTRFFTKILFVVILTLITLIYMKADDKFKLNFYKQVYDSNLSFAAIDHWYQENFGSPFPFKDILKTGVKPVFSEKLEYSEANKYKDGVALTVNKNYLVPSLSDGIVIFIGEKDGYKNTVIVENGDGIDTWYSNVDSLNVKLYDYIAKGDLIGETIDNKLYLIFKKDGKVLDYKTYIK